MKKKEKKFRSLRRYDYILGDYLEYDIPMNWNVVLVSFEMNEICNCANCGRIIKVGESYTSLEIHNKYGLGFMVCSDCYEVEMERKNKWR